MSTHLTIAQDGALAQTVLRQAGAITEREPDSSRLLSRIPSELPPELKHLLECKELGIPLKLVAYRDSALLPFSLDPSYGVVYLGFFKMASMKVCSLRSQLSPC